MALFQKGHSGRPAGTRNKLTGQCLADLLAEWEEGGRAAVKIFRLEDPAGFVKAMISTLPKEFTVEQLTSLDDGALVQYIELESRRIEELENAPAVALPSPSLPEKEKVGASDGRTRTAQSRATLGAD
jgi:hypothetical protein